MIIYIPFFCAGCQNRYSGFVDCWRFPLMKILYGLSDNHVVWNWRKMNQRCMVRHFEDNQKSKKNSENLFFC